MRPRQVALLRIYGQGMSGPDAERALGLFGTAFDAVARSLYAKRLVDEAEAITDEGRRVLAGMGPS